MDNVLVHFSRGAACCATALHEKDVHQIYQSIIPLLSIIYWIWGELSEFLFGFVWIYFAEFDE